MTAMSDVTVLLLTFFMLTSTFLQKEPITVITPPSVSEEKVPDANLLSVLVSPEGRVFLEVLGSKDSTMKSETVRADLLKNMAAEYNKMHPDDPLKQACVVRAFACVADDHHSALVFLRDLNDLPESHSHFVSARHICLADKCLKQIKNH